MNVTAMMLTRAAARRRGVILVPQELPGIKRRKTQRTKKLSPPSHWHWISVDVLSAWCCFLPVLDRFALERVCVAWRRAVVTGAAFRFLNHVSICTTPWPAVRFHLRLQPTYLQLPHFVQVPFVRRMSSLALSLTSLSLNWINFTPEFAAAMVDYRLTKLRFSDCHFQSGTLVSLHRCRLLKLSFIRCKLLPTSIERPSLEPPQQMSAVRLAPASAATLTELHIKNKNNDFMDFSNQDFAPLTSLRTVRLSSGHPEWLQCIPPTWNQLTTLELQNFTANLKQIETLANCCTSLTSLSLIRGISTGALSQSRSEEEDKRVMLAPLGRLLKLTRFMFAASPPVNLAPVLALPHLQIVLLSLPNLRHTDQIFDSVCTSTSIEHFEFDFGTEALAPSSRRTTRGFRQRDAQDFTMWLFFTWSLLDLHEESF